MITPCSCLSISAHESLLRVSSLIFGDMEDHRECSWKGRCGQLFLFCLFLILVVDLQSEDPPIRIRALGRDWFACRTTALKSLGDRTQMGNGKKIRSVSGCRLLTPLHGWRGNEKDRMRGKTRHKLLSSLFSGLTGSNKA